MDPCNFDGLSGIALGLHSTHRESKAHENWPWHSGLPLPDSSHLPLLLARRLPASSCLSNILSGSSLLWLIWPQFLTTSASAPWNFLFFICSRLCLGPSAWDWREKRGSWLMGGEWPGSPHISPSLPSTRRWKRGFPPKAAGTCRLTPSRLGCSHPQSGGWTLRWPCSRLLDPHTLLWRRGYTVACQVK